MGGSVQPAAPAAGKDQPAPLDTLRHRRRQLLAEAAKASYWRRLVQARLDLTVATTAAVDELVPLVVPGLPCPPSDLAWLVGGTTTDTVTTLLALDCAQRTLDAYAGAVRIAADDATRELVEWYTADPASCLLASEPAA